jgi:hypothetical protein
LALVFGGFGTAMYCDHEIDQRLRWFSIFFGVLLGVIYVGASFYATRGQKKK